MSITFIHVFLEYCDKMLSQMQNSVVNLHALKLCVQLCLVKCLRLSKQFRLLSIERIKCKMNYRMTSSTTVEQQQQ